MMNELVFNRLARLRTLRRLGAPLWIIRREQVMVVILRRKRTVRWFREHQQFLLDKYVRIHMGIES